MIKYILFGIGFDIGWFFVVSGEFVWCYEFMDMYRGGVFVGNFEFFFFWLMWYILFGGVWSLIFFELELICKMGKKYWLFYGDWL